MGDIAGAVEVDDGAMVAEGIGVPAVGAGGVRDLLSLACNGKHR